MLILAGPFYCEGLSFAQFLGRAAALTLYCLIPIRKKVVLKNISLSFPEKSKKEVGFIAKNTYKEFIKTLMNMFFISKKRYREGV